MPTACDVAQYLLELSGKKINTIKLQKLVYYCQAWSLVWDEKPMFQSKIEAWANGPVAPALFKAHRGEYEIDEKRNIGDSSKLSKDHKDTIEAVFETYGTKSSRYLVQLSHSEPPWRDARIGYEPGEICTNEITKAAMQEYYSSL